MIKLAVRVYGDKPGAHHSCHLRWIEEARQSVQYLCVLLLVLFVFDLVNQIAERNLHTRSRRCRDSIAVFTILRDVDDYCWITSFVGCHLA